MLIICQSAIQIKIVKCYRLSVSVILSQVNSVACKKIALVAFAYLLNHNSGNKCPLSITIKDYSIQCTDFDWDINAEFSRCQMVIGVSSILP